MNDMSNSLSLFPDENAVLSVCLEDYDFQQSLLYSQLMELNPDLSEENAEEASATFCTSHLHLVDSDVIWEKPEER